MASGAAAAGAAADEAAAGEATPLLPAPPPPPSTTTTTTTTPPRRDNDGGGRSRRRQQFRRYLMMCLIVANLVALAVQSVVVAVAASANNDREKDPYAGSPLSYTNYSSAPRYRFRFDEAFQWFVAVAFAADYLSEWVLYFRRRGNDDDENGSVRSFFRFLFGFYSLVDLASVVPFFVWNAGSATSPSSLAAVGGGNGGVVRTTTWIRVLRLLKLFGDGDGGKSSSSSDYETGTSIVAAVFLSQKRVLGTAVFIGITVWSFISSLYYLVERRNPDMIYCPSCPDVDDPARSCSIDEWGMVNCTDCQPSDVYHGGDGDLYDRRASPLCYNLYESIPSASYYALLNLFGEFPLIQQHGAGGMLVAVLTAACAVGVFAIPVGIVGNGFAQVVEERRRQQQQDQQAGSGGVSDEGAEGDTRENDPSRDAAQRLQFYANDSTARGRMYNFWHASTTPAARWTGHLIHVLVLCTVVTYMLDTLPWSPGSHVPAIMDVLEALAVVVFTVEYVLRLYCVVEDPRYRGGGWSGRWRYARQFLPVVDLLSFLPFWIQFAVEGTLLTSSKSSSAADAVQMLRLLRVFRFEKYTRAFTTFDVVFRRHADVLKATGIVAAVFWVLLGFALYYSEANNPDPEMRENYNTIPNSMWVTLLNLTGESPLCQYSNAGKVITGILGLFATGLFGIPIGVLGAGFEEIVTEENEDNVDELAAPTSEERDLEEFGGPVERFAFRLVNGFGSVAARMFEGFIYFLIFLVVAGTYISSVSNSWFFIRRKKSSSLYYTCSSFHSRSLANC